MKTVFIAHPISGNVEENAKKVIKICAKVHTKYIIPIAPYLVSIQYLNDAKLKEREKGILKNKEFFYRHFIDELWLYGDHISKGMREEIKLAQKYRIPIIPKTKKTKRDLDKLFWEP